MSAQFKIYIVDNNEEQILISDYKPNNETPTFNENLTQDENNNFTLSFSISQNYKDYFPQNFNLFEYLKIGRRLILKKPKTEEEILFTIESISPEGRNKDIIWNIVAKDYISYNFSKNNIGLSINTFESDDYLKWIEDNFLEGTASDIINYILQKGYLQEANFFSEIDNPLFLQNNWKCAFFETNLNTFKTKGLEIQENPLNKKINIDISNSNTYNALIEVALITESFILFDFKKKLVDLISRNDDFFRKNYILSPEFNLKDLSLTYSGDEFYPILYVTGGQDEFGLATTLIPFLTYKQYLILKDYFEEKDPDEELLNVIDFEEYENNFYDSVDWEGDAPTKETLLILNSIPYLDSFIINLTYYLENNLIDPNDRNEIMNRIYNDLRKINLDFQREVFNFYTTQGNINEIESRILSITDQVVLSEENDYLSLNEKLSSVYLKSGGGILDPELKADSDINPQEVFANTELTKEFLYDDGYLFYEISEEAYDFLTELPGSEKFSDWTSGKIQPKQVYEDDSDSLNIKYYASTNFKLRYPIELKFEKDGIVNSNITFTSTASSHIFDEGKPLWSDNDPNKYQLLIKTSDITEEDSLKISNSNLDIRGAKYEKEWVDSGIIPDSVIIGQDGLKKQLIPTNIPVNGRFIRVNSSNNLATRFRRTSTGQTEVVDNFQNTTINTMPVYGRWMKYEQPFNDISVANNNLSDLSLNYLVNIDSDRFVSLLTKWKDSNKDQRQIQITLRNISDGQVLSNASYDIETFRTVPIGVGLSSEVALNQVINDVRVVKRGSLNYLSIIFRMKPTNVLGGSDFERDDLNSRMFIVWIFLLNANTFIRQNTLGMETEYNSGVFGEQSTVHRKMQTFSPPVNNQQTNNKNWHFYFRDKGYLFNPTSRPQFLRVLEAGQTSPTTIRELTGNQYFNYIDSGCLLTSNNINKHWIFVATNLSSSSFRIEFIEWNGTTATNRFSQTDQTGDKVIQTYYHESKQTLFVLTNLGISVYRITLNASNNISVSSRLLISTGNIPIQGFIPSGDSLYVKRNDILQLYAIFGNNIFSWNNTTSWLSYNRPLAYWDTKSGFIYGPTDSIFFKDDSRISNAFEFYKYSYNTNVTRQTTATNENGLNLEFTNFYTLPEIKRIFRNQWKPILNYNLTTGFTIPTNFATLQSTSLQYITNLVITDFRLMPYFELLRVYGGLDFLENREKELEDLCLDFIELKNESEEAIKNTLNVTFSEYSVLETRIDGYKALIGDATGFIKNNLENQELYQSNFRRPKELKWNSIGSNLKIINKNLISFSDGSSTATTFIDVQENIKKDNVYYYKAKFKNLEKDPNNFNVFVPGDSSFSKFVQPNTWETVEGLFTGISEMKIEYTCIDGVWNFSLVNIDEEAQQLLNSGYKARIQLVRYHPARRSKVEKSSRVNFPDSISSNVRIKPNYPSYLDSPFWSNTPIVASIDISSFSGSDYKNMNANASVNLSTWANNMIKFGQKPNRIRSVKGVQQTFNNLGYFFLNYGFVVLITGPVTKKFGRSNVLEARYSFIDGDTNINPSYTITNNIVNINKAVLDAATIQSGFSCTTNSLNDETSVNFGVLLNNQGTQNITVRASLNSNFSNSITTIANGGSNIFMSLIHNTSGNPPGEVTVYVRLEKTGFTNSTAVNRTETLTICFIQ